jgi:hypothetical protein
MNSLLGTSLIALPTDIAEMLNTEIGAKKSWNGQYTVDCNTVPELPDLTFHLGGKPYPLKGTDYVLNVQGTCISAFTPMDINLPDGSSIWIVGKCLRQHRNTCVASANLHPVQVTFSFVATTPCMISAVTLLDLLKLFKFIYLPFIHSVIHRNDKYYCTLAIPSRPCPERERRFDSAEDVYHEEMNQCCLVKMVTHRKSRGVWALRRFCGTG